MSVLRIISETVNEIREGGNATLPVMGRAFSIVFFPGIILALFVVSMLVLSGARLDIPAIFELVYGGIVIVAAGFALVIWTNGENGASRLALAILLGSIVTSLFLAAGCLLTGQGAGTVFSWWSVITAMACFWTFTKTGSVKPIEFQEVLSILVIGSLSGLWCRRSASALSIVQATGVVPVWSDYFIHATEIAEFGDPLAVGQSSFLLVNQPIVLYHYASYMLAAAVAGLANISALGIATSVLLPYGIFLTALGSYAFASTVVGEIVALLAPFALLLVPDASTYGFQNGFFGFHWLLFTAPGSGYGLGVAFTALALVAIWRSEDRPRCLWLGILLAIALFEFRAQIFLLFAPTLAMTLFWETDFIQRRARVAFAALLIVIAVSALSFIVVPAVRKAWLRYSGCRTFLEIAHTGQQPTAYDGVYQVIQQHYGQPSAWFVGVCLLFPITLGAMTFMMPLGLIGAIRRTGWRPLDSFPVWCLVTWVGLVLLAPIAAYGGREEYQHRPFVLVYAVILVWTLIFVDRAITGTLFGFCRLKPLLLTLFIAFLIIRTAFGWTDDPAQPRFQWGKRSFGVKLEPGLLAAANYVRAQAGVGDTFALVPIDPAQLTTDAATRFAALANVPTYLARVAFQVRYGRKRYSVAEQRLAELSKIEASDRTEDAFQELSKIGVRFLVVLGEKGPRFDPDRAKTAFQSQGVAVYRVERPK